ncbi:MAG: hypothetical protein KGJ93_05290 [Patescibacteria group bacterium]|nr:hypothetical protein [Patescibacteria group bacterium]
MPFRRVLANITDLIQGADRLVLDADATAGQNTLTVQNIISAATNQILFIGEPGSERSEIIATHASTAPSGSTVTLAANLAQPHPAGTSVYIVRANMVHFFWSSQQVDANVDASSLVSLAAAKAIDPTSVNNHYDDSVQSSGYYYYRFEDNVNNVNLNYSSGIPWQEQSPHWAQNQVGYLLEKARRKIGFEWGDKFSKQDAIDEINDCFDYIDGAQLRWPRHFVNDYVLGQLSMGEFEFSMPANIYDSSTNRSILNLRIAGQITPLYYRDTKEFENMMENAVFTTIRVQANPGDTTLQVVNSDNFPIPSGSSSATVHGFATNVDDAISYTGVTVSSTAGVLTGVPNSGTGAISVIQPVGTKIWANPSNAQPYWFTVIRNKIRIWPLPSAQFLNLDVLLDYYTVANRVQFESDILDEDRYDMVQKWLLWKAKSYTRNNGKDDLQDADFLQFMDILKQAVKFKRSGQKFKWKPKINQIMYPGRRTSRIDENNFR